MFKRISNALTQLHEGIGIAIGSLGANKGRASLTILGVSIGVAVVMVIASMITGINRGVTDIVEQLGPRTFFVFRFFQGGIVISDGSDDDPRRRNPPLTLQEAAAIEALPIIDLVVPRQETRRQVEYESETLSSVGIRGLGVRWLEVSGGDVYPGRSFTRLEQEAATQVAVVNAKLAERLFGHLDPVGRRIKIGGEPYRVIGVYTPPPDRRRPTQHMAKVRFDFAWRTRLAHRTQRQRNGTGRHR